MNNLTAAVLETLESHAYSHGRCREIARNTPVQEYRHQTAEAIGKAICVEIGERLSLRFDGAVPKDGIHDILWNTFMANVDWEEVGGYYFERI